MSKISATVKNLTIIRSEKYIFKDLSFHVDSTSPILISGQNGSGKTTLLRALAGVLGHFKGNICFSKTPYTTTYLSHNNYLYDHLKISENIVFWRKTEGLSESFEDYFLIKNFYDQYPCQLSQGQRKRVYLSKLINNQADIILIDEPLSDLDQNMIDILILMIEEWQKQNKLIFLTSHIPIAGPKFQIIPL